MGKILIIPDSFKGSLSSVEAAEILEKSARDAGYDTISVPLADGGEGTVDCVLRIRGGEKIRKTVTGPDGNETDAVYGITSDGTAVIEIAESTGITKQRELHPMTSETSGFGMLISDAYEKGARNFLLCLGGSASTDCGTGMASELGVRFLDADGNSFVPCGETLQNIASVDATGIFPFVKECSFRAMCDVTNPLFGPDGAAYVFAPQKGADEEEVRLLDEGLKNVAKLVTAATNTDLSHIKGAGAAGGVGYACAVFLNARIMSGIDTMLDICDFDTLTDECDMIVTGEGKTDRQSLMGKVLSGILRRTDGLGKKIAVFCGKNELDSETAEKLGIEIVQTAKGISEEYSMKNAAKYLKKAADLYFGERIY